MTHQDVDLAVGNKYRHADGQRLVRAKDYSIGGYVQQCSSSIRMPKNAIGMRDDRVPVALWSRTRSNTSWARGEVANPALTILTYG